MELQALLREARALSRRHVGGDLQCFIPGRMHYMNERGRYPTVSITGSACALNCETEAITVAAGVGCATAVINAALGRESTCCCAEGQKAAV